MAVENPESLVFALCHEAGSLLTALRFHAAAAASDAGDETLRSVATQLSTRIGALLALVRPLLEGPQDSPAGADSAQLLSHVERELTDAGVAGLVCRPDASLPIARCDSELLRQLLIARILAVIEPGEAPVRVTLTSAACDRGIEIRVSDTAVQRAAGATASRGALVDRIAGSLLARIGGAVVAEHGLDGNCTRLELEIA